MITFVWFRPVRRRRCAPLVTALVIAVACAGGGGESDARDAGTLIVYNAGSLARPLRAALDSFAARTGATIEQESAGSLESARKLTELGKIPDVIALADYKVFPQLLVPAHVTWYAAFARNRMVLAHTPRSRFANEITGDNWWEILTRPGVETGRSDPNLDPNGYRTLLVFQLAELHHRQPGLATRLLDAAPTRNVRPKEVDLVALLQAGELDYIWSYESVAQATSLPYVRLADQVDLGAPGDSALYARAEVRVAGAGTSDSITFRGEPIVYALSIPTAAPHRELAERFVAYLLSPDGARVLRATRLDILAEPIVVGSGVPASIDSLRRDR
jgi:molybdate/tungstate transport system substrate-binding protein